MNKAPLTTGSKHGDACTVRAPDHGPRVAFSMGLELKDFRPMIEHWLPLTFAINSLNRSMGQQDLYPFVLPQPAIDKMDYVHRTIRTAAKRS